MPDNLLEEKAITAALQADWETAITLNREIQKADHSNIESYNRLGRAYSEIGQIEKAKSSYREVLKRDPYNSIALKNLERLKASKGKTAKITGSTTLSPDQFMEEPGKTKVLELQDLAKPEILARLHTGDIVKVAANDSSLRFEDAAGTRLGTYKGDLSIKLAEFVRNGSVYNAYVQSVKPTEVKIFVREVRRAPKFINTPSFPTVNSGFKPYVHETATLIMEDQLIDGETQDTTATEAEVRKKIASVESLVEKETETTKSESEDPELS
jgi:hypothetical protein